MKNVLLAVIFLAIVLCVVVFTNGILVKRDSQQEVVTAAANIDDTIAACDFDATCIELALIEAQLLPPSEILDLRLKRGEPLISFWDDLSSSFASSEDVDSSEIVEVLLKHGQLESAKNYLSELRRKEPIVGPSSGFALPMRATNPMVELLLLTLAGREISQQSLSAAELAALARETQSALPAQFHTTLISKYLARSGRWDIYAEWFHDDERTNFVDDAQAAVVHASELNRAAFLATVASRDVWFHDSLHTLLNRLIGGGWRPQCFDEKEIDTFLAEGQWPDFKSTRPLCLALIYALEDPADIAAVLLRAHDYWRKQPEGARFLAEANLVLKGSFKAGGNGRTAIRLNLYVDDEGVMARVFTKEDTLHRPYYLTSIDIQQRQLSVLEKLLAQGAQPDLSPAEVMNHLFMGMKNSWGEGAESRGIPVSVTPQQEVAFWKRIQTLELTSDVYLAVAVAVSLVDAAVRGERERFAALRQFKEEFELNLNRKEVFAMIESAADELTETDLVSALFDTLVADQPINAEWFHLQRPLEALWRHGLCAEVKRYLATESGRTIWSYSNYLVLRSWLLSDMNGCWRVSASKA